MATFCAKYFTGAAASPKGDNLFGKLPGIDPDYDLIMEESLAKNVYPLAKLEAARAAAHTSLCAKFCTPEIWEKYKDLKSTGKVPQVFVVIICRSCETMFGSLRRFFYPCSFICASVSFILNS